jgi:hypothetical protein
MAKIIGMVAVGRKPSQAQAPPQGDPQTCGQTTGPAPGRAPLSLRHNPLAAGHGTHVTRFDCGVAPKLTEA